VKTPLIAPDSELLRRLAYAGARYGPRFWLRHSPPWFGLAFGAALPRLRAAVRENLRLVHGPRPRLIEQLDVARTFTQYAHCLAEALAMDRPEARASRRRIRGEEHLHAAVARGGGVVLVTAHIGPWDAAARLLALDLSAEVIVVMTKEPDSRARRLHDDVRQRDGVRVTHVGAHPLDGLPLLRHLRARGVVAVQLDRLPPSGRTLSVALFDRPFFAPEGPFRLAALAGAAVLPLFVRRVGPFDYEFDATPPILLPKRPDPSRLRAAAQAAVTEMERFIRAHPTQWFHFDRHASETQNDSALAPGRGVWQKDPKSAASRRTVRAAR
jgi:phosphatidylinositol dimannoside acyltransferase